jgi:predicted ATPase/signal transduction histidine kinase
VIAGYQDFREIYRGARFVVYRARPARTDAATVVVKTVLADRPARQEAEAGLAGEHQLLGRLNGAAGVVRPIALERAGGLPALVLQDAGPRTMEQCLGGQALPLPRFLGLATKLCEVVAGIHAHQVVHADLNPSNVVFDEAGNLTVIDFDGAIAAAAGRLIDESRELASNLLYLAPEQTGRMNRPVERTADLYALGAIFYTMLTGGPPFPFADPVELVHAHLARTAVPPAVVDPRVPPLLSDLVMKLLAKMPERRYPSAESLAADLRRAAARLDPAGEIRPFELGVTELASELPPPERIFGRDPEVEQLSAAWQRVRAGGRELLCLQGAAGEGKTALASELARRVTGQGGWFLAGKCDLPAGNTPYGPLVDAFRVKVLALLEQPSAGVALWRERIREAVGANGRVLTELIPELERLIGPQPALAAVGALETENRFRLVLQAFVRLLAAPEHPLALFLDDLQWADAASLKLFRDLATAPEAAHLLLLAAYRGEEVPGEGPVARALQAIVQAGVPAQTLDLGPLTADDVLALLADSLRCPPVSARPLAQLVRRKTAGNPFFIQGLLRFLHQSGLLVFDGTAAAWVWNLNEIEKVALGDDVVQLLLRALGQLPADTQELMTVAACFGRTAPLTRISALVGRPSATCAQSLARAVRAGLLVAAEGRSGPEGAAVTFVHDRIQQAAYQLSDERRRRHLHRRIGELLLSGLAATDSVFQAVDQLNLGTETTAAPDEWRTLADLNLRAARQAKGTSAYGPALEYLRRGIALLPASAWETSRELYFSLHREAIECAYVTGENELGDQLFEEALSRSPSRLLKADLCGLRAVANIGRIAHQEGVHWGLVGLRDFGVDLLGVDSQAAVAAEFAAVTRNLGDRPPGALLEAPRMRDPEQLACMQLLAKVSSAAYVGRPDLAPFMAARMVNLSILHGNASDSALAYVSYAAWLVRMRDDHATAHAFGRLGIDLGAQLDDPVAQCRAVAGFTAQVACWLAPVRSQLPGLREVGRRGMEAGELQFGISCLTTAVALLFHQGAPFTQVQEEIESAAAAARRIRLQNAEDELAAYRQAIRCLAGSTRGLDSFDDEGFVEARHLERVARSPLQVGLYRIRRLQTAYLLGRCESARSLAAEAAPLLRYARTSVLQVEHNHYSSLTWAACAREAAPAERAQLVQAIADNQRQLAAWAGQCPANYQHKHLLVEAELASLQGRTHEAESLYDRAIEGAAQERFIQDEALASELAGRFYRALGRGRVAALYLSAAVEGYRRWGARGKARALADELPDLTAVGGAGEGPSRPPGRLAAEALDLESLLRAAETISGEVELDRLLGRLMEVCLAAAGAQRGALLLEEEDGLQLRALATVGQPPTLQRTALQDSDDVPRRVIHHVRKCREPLALADAFHHVGAGAFAEDPYVAHHAVRSVLALPICQQATLVAILYLENNLATRVFTPDRVQLLQLLSSQMAVSLKNSLLFAALTRQIEDRKRAEAAVGFLAGASVALGESLDYQATLARVAQLAVPLLADWCTVDMIEQGDVRRVAAVHKDPDKHHLLEQMRGDGPESVAPLPARHAIESATAQLYSDVTHEMLQGFAANPEALRLCEAVGVRSAMVVPLRAHGRALGALCFVLGESPRRYGPRDLELAEELARRAAAAIENARLYGEAQEAVRVRDEFLSVASHELNTPMASLALSLGGLTAAPEGRPPDAATMAKLSGLASRQMRRLTRLIEQLLDATRIDRGSFTLRLEEVELTSLVQEAVTRFQPELDRARCPVLLNLEGPIHGFWDPVRIEQVLVNLLSNATKFAAGAQIEIRTARGHDGAQLAVRDQGIGIDPTRQSRIFDRFERAVSARHYGGLGLGLYICRRIAESHGGSIVVQSEPDKGATFLVTLPCRNSRSIDSRPG